MDADFWHKKWENNDITFHKSTPNPSLIAHIEALSLAKGSIIFIPLCGKTLDISWLLSNGYRIIGVELVELAIKQLFTELGLAPKIFVKGKIKLYSAHNIDIYVGNIFDVSHELVGPVDAIYDKAALVALPAEVRPRYTAHLMDITHQSSQLLIVYHYDQNLMQGPPFSISNEEISQLYKNSYNVTLAASIDIAGGIKGKHKAKENVWLLLNHD